MNLVGSIAISPGGLLSRAVACAVFLAAAAPSQSSRPSRAEHDQAVRQAASLLHAGKVQSAMTILQGLDLSARSPKARVLLSYAYQSRGKGRFNAKKLDLAYRDFYAANRLTPGEESVLQSLGVISYRLKRRREAESYMRRVVKKNPSNAQALAILGHIAQARDDIAVAGEYFQRAASQAPGRKDFHQMATKLGKEAEVERRFVTLDKGNFRVQFERGKHVGVEKAVHSVHQFLEQAHRDLVRELGASPDHRITVVIYNKSQYRRVSSAHAWARAYFDGKVRVATERWPIDRSALRKDVRHELTHAFLHSLYPKTPTWLHEGLAQMIEGRAVAGAATKFRNGQYRPLPLATLFGDFTNTKDAAAARIGYAQALALVGYLQRKGGRRRLQALLGVFGSTEDSSRALAGVYGESAEDLLKAALK